MLNSNQYTEGGFLLQQPSFDMDHDYGFFEMEDFDDLKDTRDENFICDDDDRSAVEEPSSILTPSIIEQLSLQTDEWECLFSSTRDGPSFGTFMRHVRGHMRTIVLAKAVDGQIYGVYATDAWSGRGRTAGRSDETFLFEVPTSAAKRGQMSPLAQPSSHASFGSFIPGLDNLMGSSPTSAIDFDTANISSSSKTVGASIDVVKSSSTTCGFNQVCQLSNKFIGVSDGEVSFSIEGSFSRGSTQSATQNRKEFDIVEFEVYGLLEG
jgi:hypothetical protein